VIKFSKTIPDKHAYYHLFLTTGWNNDDPMSIEELGKALKKSWYAISAYNQDKLVGHGRIISDGIHHALIVDMIVHPQWKGQGIGKTILKKLIEKCCKHKIRDIQLFCASGKQTFYRRFGFHERPLDAPGMQWKKDK